MLSDEAGIIPPSLNRLYKVFRTYNHRRLYDNKKIFPIPCGYCGQLQFQNAGKYEHAEEIHKPLSERNYDIIFSGQVAPNRRQALAKVETMKSDFNVLLNITNGFGRGFTIPEYYEKLNDSKISIVPNGAVIPESFRYFESFESGCITISSYPVHDINYRHWYYEKSSAIFIRNWNELSKELIRSLLDRKEELYEKNREYYNNSLSSLAVANYIKNNL